MKYIDFLMSLLTANGEGGGGYPEPTGEIEITANGTYNVKDAATAAVDVAAADLTEGVHFIDYDGTVLYSYTKEKFLTLTEMPANPTHTGLTSQGWNWSLADAQAYVTDYGNLIIGQQYITDDGSTRIYVTLDENTLKPYLGIGVNGTVEVDWGDGSTPDTLTGTSLTSAKYIQHIYTTAGDYAISLTVTSGSINFFGTSNGSRLLLSKNTNPTLPDKAYLTKITKIEIGEGVGIGAYAFNSCYALASVTIPDSVTSIGDSAFNSCYALASVTIPDSVTSIGGSAFSSCYALASVEIPDSVTSIGANAFQNCYTLASVEIPDSVTSIGANAFQNCYALASVEIPDSVTSIGNSAFSTCYALASVEIPDSVTSIGTNVFQNCYTLASVTIPDSVTSIGTYAFSICCTLASVTIPDSVTSIGTYAFSGCHSLASVEIPDSVTSIGTSAFQNCRSLTSVEIPDSVTSIGAYAFQSAEGVFEFHVLPTTPPTLGSAAFSGINSACVIYVPAGTLATYQAATNWSAYASYMQEEAV